MRGRRRLSAWKGKCLILSGTAADVSARWRPAKLRVGPNQSEDNEGKKRRVEGSGRRKKAGSWTIGRRCRQKVERTSWTLWAAVIRATLAAVAHMVIAISQWASPFVLSCVQSVKKRKKEEKKLDAFVLSATDLKRQMTQQWCWAKREGFFNTSAR